MNQYSFTVVHIHVILKNKQSVLLPLCWWIISDTLTVCDRDGKPFPNGKSQGILLIDVLPLLIWHMDGLLCSCGVQLTSRVLQLGTMVCQRVINLQLEGLFPGWWRCGSCKYRSRVSFIFTSLATVCHFWRLQWICSHCFNLINKSICKV